MSASTGYPHNRQLNSLMYPGMTIFFTWLAGALESAILGRGQRSSSIMLADGDDLLDLDGLSIRHIPLHVRRPRHCLYPNHQPRPPPGTNRRQRCHPRLMVSMPRHPAASCPCYTSSSMQAASDRLLLNGLMVFLSYLDDGALPLQSFITTVSDTRSVVLDISASWKRRVSK